MQQISTVLKERFAQYGLEVLYFDAIDRPLSGMNFQIVNEDGDEIASMMSLEALEQWLAGADFARDLALFAMGEMMP